jgi:uncharacterized protein GlcG (DUF336 family)
MGELTLRQALAIAESALGKGRELSLDPLTVAVVDRAGHVKVLIREDGPGGPIRPGIAYGKAFGAVAMGRSSRRLGEMALERPHFVTALVGVTGGNFVPVPGGVTILADGDELLGAVGVSGDTSDNDEACAISGIEAAGLRAGS